MNLLWNKEKPFIINLGLTVLAILIGWLILGWTPDLLMTAHDGAAGSQPLLRELVRSQVLSWQNYIYLFKPVGGNLGHDLAAVLPFMQWARTLGFGAFGIEILQVFLLQTLFAFFILQFIISFKTIYIKGAIAFSVYEKFFIALAMAFAPFLAWRIWYGHELLILGALPFVILNSLWAHIYAQKNHFSITVVLMAIIGLINTVPSSGQQTFIYSAIFGLPFTLLMGIDFIKREKKLGTQSLLFAVGILVIALLLIAPQYVSILVNALGGDSSRGLGTEKITYSYVTGELYDWLSSLTLVHEFFEPERNFFFYHEVNYGFGPLILFLILAFFKKLRNHLKVTLGLFTAILLSFMFTNNYFLSDQLIDLVPILKNFRVPHRSILVLMGAIYTVSFLCFEYLWATNINDSETSGKDATTNRTSNKKTVSAKMNHKPHIVMASISGLTGIIAFFLKIHYYEFIAWSAGLFFLTQYFRGQQLQIHLRLPFLIVLGFSTLMAFQERQIRWIAKEEVTNSWDGLESSLKQMAPNLKNPLYRAKLNFQIPNLHVNSGFGVATAQIEGYMPPPSRFAHLVASLEGSTFDTTRNVFQFTEASPAFTILQALYNVAYIFDLKDGRELQLRQTPNAFAPAWFATQWEPVNDWQSLSTTLKANQNNIKDYLQTKGLYMSSDSFYTDNAFTNLFNETQLQSCRDRILAFGETSENIDKENLLKIKINKSNSVSNKCLLTVATNYSKKLKAQNEKGETLITLPVYGSLLGVIIDADTTELTLYGEPSVPGIIFILPWLGLLLLGGTIALSLVRLQTGML